MGADDQDEMAALDRQLAAYIVELLRENPQIRAELASGFQPERIEAVVAALETATQATATRLTAELDSVIADAAKRIGQYREDRAIVALSRQILAIDQNVAAIINVMKTEDKLALEAFPVQTPAGPAEPEPTLPAVSLQAVPDAPATRLLPLALSFALGVAIAAVPLLWWGLTKGARPDSATLPAPVAHVADATAPTGATVLAQLRTLPGFKAAPLLQQLCPKGPAKCAALQSPAALANATGADGKPLDETARLALASLLISRAEMLPAAAACGAVPAADPAKLRAMQLQQLVQCLAQASARPLPAAAALPQSAPATSDAAAPATSATAPPAAKPKSKGAGAGAGAAPIVQTRPPTVPAAAPAAPAAADNATKLPVKTDGQ